jgi:ferritin-like metal-binding protein YciE
MDAESKLISWLKDVHAIKRHTAKALASYAREVGSHPISKAIAAHAAQTEGHLATIERELRALGHSPSVMGGAVARILGAGQMAASRFLGDRLLTNGAGGLALEELEIATLSAVGVGAVKAGHPGCAKACRGMAREDQQFLASLGRAFASLTKRYLDS